MSPRVAAGPVGRLGRSALPLAAGLWIACAAAAVAAEDRLLVPASGSARGASTETAAVTVVEFSDMTKPAARLHASELDALLLREPRSLRHVYRHALPEGDRSAWFVAMALECAGRQGKFWEARHAALTRPTPPTIDDLRALADEASLDADALESCLIAQPFQGRLQVDLDFAASIGITEAPRYFVNGVPLPPGAAPEALTALVERESARPVAPAGPGAAADLDARLEQARELSRRYFATIEEADHSWAAVVDYLNRRHGAGLTLADGRTVRAGLVESSPSSVGAAFARLWSPDASVPSSAIESLRSPIDRATTRALHCQTLPLPPEWPAELDRLSQSSPYALTHSVLALQWSVENGCLAAAEAEPLRARLVDSLVALAASRADLSATAAGDDIWFESLAMLHYAGHGERVKRAWLDELLDAQRPQGGWAAHPGAHQPHPHASALATWVVLATLDPGLPVAMIPQAPARAEVRP